jgi:hypothetical protein
MLRLSTSVALLFWTFTAGFSAAADKPEADPKKVPAWLAEWEYPKAGKADWKTAGDKLSNAVIITTDDLEKVFQHYEKKTCVIDKKLKSADGKTEANLSSAASIILPGGYAVMKVSVDEEMARKLGINPSFTRILYGARDDSLQGTKKEGKTLERPVVVRTLFQDTNEYNVHIVVSRAKAEDETHVIITYVRK